MALLLLCACGRIGFDQSGITTDGGDDAAGGDAGDAEPASCTPFDIQLAAMSPFDHASVAWTGTTWGVSALNRLQLVSTTGDVVDGPAPTDQIQAINWNGVGFSTIGHDAGDNIGYQETDATGVEIGIRQPIANGVTGGSERMEPTSAGFTTLFSKGGNVQIRALSGDGVAIANAVTIGSGDGGDIAGGATRVAVTGRANNLANAFFRTADPDGSNPSTTIQLNAGVAFSDVEWLGDRFALVTASSGGPVSFQTFDEQGASMMAPVQLFATGSGIVPRIVWDGSHLIAVWSRTDGTLHQFEAIEYTETGVAISPAIPIHTLPTGAGVNEPAIASGGATRLGIVFGFTDGVTNEARFVQLCF